MRDYDYDDDYDYDYNERPAYDDRSRYEVKKIYVIGRPRAPDIFPRRGGKFSTSGTELAHLTIAYIILVICFAVAFTFGLGGIMYGFFLPELFMSRFAMMFPVSLIAVALGFILHEMAHKLTAQHFGHWSEFRYDGRGLLMALVFSVIAGFVYAAPGATWISGNITRRQNGLISLAGPVVNIIIAGSLVPITLMLPAYSDIQYYIVFIGLIIAFLGFFNMLPIYPLDGSKIWAWNKGIFIITIIIAIALVAFYYILLLKPSYILG